MSQNVARRLRPYLFHGFKQSQAVVLRRTFVSSHAVLQKATAAKDVTHDYEKRLVQLDAYKPPAEWHPRLSREIQPAKTSVKEFRRDHGSLAEDETANDIQTVIGTSAKDSVMEYIAHSRQRRQSTIRPYRRLETGVP